MTVRVIASYSNMYPQKSVTTSYTVIHLAKNTFEITFKIIHKQIQAQTIGESNCIFDIAMPE